MVKCNNCGYDNPDDSLYCSKCGSKLERISYCKKCGNKLEPDAIYCNKCGTKVRSDMTYSEATRVDEIHNDEAKEAQNVQKDACIIEKNTNKRSLVAISELSLKIVVIIFSIVSMISIFGDFIKSSISSNGMQYWFTYGWNVMKYNTSYTYSKIMFVLGFVLYVGTIIAVIVSGIIAICNSMALINKKNILNKKMKPAVYLCSFFALFYFIVLKSSFSSEIYQNGSYDGYSYIYSKTSTRFGWGAILFFVFFALLLVAVMFKKISHILENKNDCCKEYSISRIVIPLVLLFAFILVSFGPMIGYAYYNNEYLYISSFSPLALAKTLSTVVVRSEAQEYVAPFVLSLMSSVLLLVSIGLACGSLLKSLVNNSTQGKGVSLVLNAVSVGIYFVAASLFTSAVAVLCGINNYDSEIKMGITFSPILIFGILIGVGLVVSSAIFSKQKNTRAY